MWLILFLLVQGTDVAVRPNAAGQMQIAPLTGDSKGLRRAEIRQGVREVMLCKDQDGKMGLRVRSVNKVFEYYTFDLPLCTVVALLNISSCTCGRFIHGQQETMTCLRFEIDCNIQDTTYIVVICWSMDDSFTISSRNQE